MSYARKKTIEEIGIEKLDIVQDKLIKNKNK